MFQIPKTIQLFGHTITTEFDEKLEQRDCRMGEADYIAKKIKLQPAIEDYQIDSDYIEQVWCHELLHWIFYLAGYSRDSNNEAKVDLLSNLLYQALHSATYSDKMEQIIQNGINDCLIKNNNIEIKLEKNKKYATKKNNN